MGKQEKGANNKHNMYKKINFGKLRSYIAVSVVKFIILLL